MAIQTKQTEEFLLKIVKIIVLAGMALALLMVLILGANVAYQSTKTPQEPAPAQKAPEKEVSMEELKKFLLNGDKADEAQSPASSPKSIAPSLHYLEEVTRLYRCSFEFGKKVVA